MTLATRPLPTDLDPLVADLRAARDELHRLRSRIETRNVPGLAPARGAKLLARICSEAARVSDATAKVVRVRDGDCTERERRLAVAAGENALKWGRQVAVAIHARLDGPDATACAF